MNPSELLYQMHEGRYQFFFGKIARIHKWGNKHLKAPFWRCYCPLDAGGIILYRGERLPLMPGKGYIVPPFTDFGSLLDNRFCKAFCHFSYEIANCRIEPGIYEFGLEGRDLWQLKRMSSAPEKIGIGKFEMLIQKITAQGVAEIPVSAISSRNIDPRTESLLKWIDSQDDYVIPNKVLSKKIRMTDQSLIRIFKKSLGISPQKYQQQRRLEEACTLLAETEMSIEEIAERCGFWDRNHFTRAFTKFLSCPPAAYRKINK